MNLWNKIKTWARIQRRMAWLYFAEFYWYFEWPIRILINWLILLSCPFWIGFAFVLWMLNRAYLSKKNVENRVLKGKIWFWQMFVVH